MEPRVQRTVSSTSFQAGNRFLAWAATVSLILIGYIVAHVLTATADQAGALRWAESFLLTTFSAGSLFHYKFFGISTRHLPQPGELREIDCDSFFGECRDLCNRLKKERMRLESNDKVRTPKLVAKQTTLYSFGAGGLIFALATSGGWIAIVAAALCIPGLLSWVFDLLPSSRRDWRNVKEWADEIGGLWQEFLSKCMKSTP